MGRSHTCLVNGILSIFILLAGVACCIIVGVDAGDHVGGKEVMYIIILPQGIMYMAYGVIGVATTIRNSKHMFIGLVVLGTVIVLTSLTINLVFYISTLLLLISGTGFALGLAWVLTITSTALAAVVACAWERSNNLECHTGTTSTAPPRKQVVRLPADMGPGHYWHPQPYVIKYSV